MALFRELARATDPKRGAVVFGLLAPDGGGTVDVLRLEGDGRVILRGQEIGQNTDLIDGFLQWLKAVGVHPGPGGNVTVQGGAGGSQHSGGDVRMYGPRMPAAFGAVVPEAEVPPAPAPLVAGTPPLAGGLGDYMDMAAPDDPDLPAF